MLKITLLIALTAGFVFSQTKPAAPKAPEPKSDASSEDADVPDDDLDTQLAKVKRVYVDMLSGGESGIKLRDLLMSSLRSAKVFIVTEDEDRADAVLKGTGEDTTFTESHSSSEGINGHTSLSLPDLRGGSTVSGTASNRYSDRMSASMAISENENQKSDERKHEALATVRLVSKNGDVLWSCTQESFGGKFLGAAADVADKVSKRLLADVRKAKAAASSPGR